MYALNIIGLLYTEDLDQGFTLISRQVSFILFPLFYASYALKNVKLLIKLYCFAIVLFILIFEIHTLYRFFYKSDIFPLDLELFLSFRYTGAELTKILNMHNAYFGMFTVLSNVFIIEFIKTTKKSTTVAFLLFLIVFQTLFLLQMVAKTAIILNILIVLPSLIYLLVYNKKFKALVFFLLLTLGVGVFVSLKFNLPLNRITARYQEITKNSSMSTGTRIVLWQKAEPTIKEYLIFGTGTGDTKNILRKVYKSNQIEIHSNIHNQYLDYLLRFGVVGFLVFLSVLLYGFITAIKLKNYVYFCFLIIIAGSCMTENIISRQWGIVFFASFNYLLFLTATKKYKWE